MINKIILSLILVVQGLGAISYADTADGKNNHIKSNTEYLLKIKKIEENYGKYLDESNVLIKEKMNNMHGSESAKSEAKKLMGESAKSDLDVLSKYISEIKNITPPPEYKHFHELTLEKYEENKKATEALLVRDSESARQHIEKGNDYMLQALKEQVVVMQRLSNTAEEDPLR